MNNYINKENKLILATSLILATMNVQAVQYSNTGFEQVAEDYVIFKLSDREAATVNFRTVCDPIYGSDDANCSVRLYDGLRGDLPGEYIRTYLLECDKQDCKARQE